MKKRGARPTTKLSSRTWPGSWPVSKLVLAARLPEGNGTDERIEHFTAGIRGTFQPEKEHRVDRRPHAHGIPGGARRLCAKRAAGSTKSGGLDAGAKWDRARAALRRLPIGRP